MTARNIPLSAASPFLSEFDKRALVMGFETDASCLLPPVIQAQKSQQADDVIELQRKIGRLRQELIYYKDVVNIVLLPLLAELENLATRLLSVVQDCEEAMNSETLSVDA